MHEALVLGFGTLLLLAVAPTAAFAPATSLSLLPRARLAFRAAHSACRPCIVNERDASSVRLRLHSAWASTAPLPSSDRHRRMLLRGGASQCANNPVMSGSAAAAPAASVQVYTTSGCRYCKIAKAKLSELGIPFSEIDVSETPGDPKSGEMRKALAVRVGKTSVPQIFVAGEHVGGCDALLTAVEEGSFGRLLASAGIVAAPPSAVAPLDIEDAGPSIDLAPKDGTLNYHHHLAHLLNDGTDSPESCGEGADSGGGSGGGGGGGGGVDASAVALDLQARTLRLFDEFVSADGRSVDFKRMASSRAMRVYLASAARLSHPSLLLSLQDMKEEAKKAFWINVYNALVLHGGNHFSKVRYNVGGLPLSLDEIEHAILRGSPEGDARSFNQEDVQRRALVIPRRTFDPRIHFALNCGARSCPPIKLYSAENLDEALGLAAQAFCESEVEVDASAKTVTLSKILMWYWGDFAPKEDVGALLGVIQSYMQPTSPTASSLASLLRAPNEILVMFSEYDWSRNDAP